MNIIKFIFDIALPRFCVGCAKEGSSLCNSCYELIQEIRSQKCPFCESEELGGFTCEKHKKAALDGCFSVGYYHDPLLRNSLHKFKYYFDEEVGEFLAQKLLTSVLKHKNIFPIDAVVLPIPLAPRRLRERGFNQSEMFARSIFKRLGYPILKNKLVRIKNTHPQAKLPNEERLENLKNAFLIKNPELVRDKNIILIDDVLTTGATVESAAGVLKSSGAKMVYGIVLARG